MFMIPTPPTTRDGGIGDLEVRGLTQRNAVTVHHQRFDFLLGDGHQFGRAGRGQSDIDVVEVRALESFSDGGKGHQNDVVLVIPDDVGAFADQDPDDFKGDVFDTDVLTDGVCGLE